MESSLIRNGWRTALLLLMALSLPATAATALIVKPAGTFEAKGKLWVSAGFASAKCDAVFTGAITENGRVQIMRAQFSGFNPACSRLKATMLPWQGEAISATQLRLTGVQVEVNSVVVNRVCGPVTLMADWQASGSLLRFPDVKLPPDCYMTGALKVAPSFLVLES